MKTSRAPRKKPAAKEQPPTPLFPGGLDQNTGRRFVAEQVPFAVGKQAGKLAAYLRGAPITGAEMQRTFGVGKWSEWYSPAEVGMAPLWTFREQTSGSAFFVCTDRDELVVEAEIPAMVPDFVAWLVQQTHSTR